MILSKEKEQEYIEKVKKDPIFLKEIEDQTEVICLEAVRRYGQVLEYVKEQTPELCLKAVKRDGWALEYVKDQTPEICLEAVKENIYALQFVKEKTLKICSEAVKQSKWALQFVKEQTEEMKLMSLFNGYEPLDEFDNFYDLIEAPTTEMNFIYALLKNSREYQLPSYQKTRLKLALKQIRLTDSPYHVLEQLYSR